ncbi:MAG TPA: PilZ domain-containing protein [Bacteriovoracaceae bacterium]|nr:PilZ domain-containing protein [Bacteriovoracaceae bacterium]
MKSVKDKGIILNLLSGSKEGSFEVFIWKLIGGSKIMAQVRIESIRKLRNDFCIVPSEGQDRSVQELMSSQPHMDLYIPEASIIFRCPVKQTDAPYRYYLQLPEFVAQIERRKDFRLNVYDDSEVKVSFAKSTKDQKPMSQHFLKNCFDVSRGGFSFLISKMESKFFQVGDEVPVLEIKAGDWSTKVSFEVSTIRELAPDETNNMSYKVWRVGCKFSKIDQISRKYLEKYVFERIKEELHAINE